MHNNVKTVSIKEWVWELEDNTSVNIWHGLGGTNDDDDMCEEWRLRRVYMDLMVN